MNIQINNLELAISDFWLASWAALWAAATAEVMRSFSLFLVGSARPDKSFPLVFFSTSTSSLYRPSSFKLSEKWVTPYPCLRLPIHSPSYFMPSLRSQMPKPSRLSCFHSPAYVSTTSLSDSVSVSFHWANGLFWLWELKPKTFMCSELLLLCFFFRLLILPVTILSADLERPLMEPSECLLLMLVRLKARTNLQEAKKCPILVAFIMSEFKWHSGVSGVSFWGVPTSGS